MTSQPSSAMPRRINLGCGYDRREGYLNVDLHEFHEPDLVADVRDLSALPDDYFEEILAIDVLEHLPRTDTRATLAEWRRVLAVGGVLTVQVPDVVAIGKLLLERDSRADHELFLHHLYGTQAYNGDFHLAGFTDRSMIGFLHDEGFEAISTRCEHRWLLVATCTKADPNSPRSTALAYGFSQGIYAPESDGVGGTYRWCESRGSILIENLTGSELGVELELGVAGHFDATPVQLTVEGLGDAQVYDLGSTTEVVRTATRLPVDGLRLRLESAGPRVDAGDDVRDLRFRLMHFAAHVAR